MAFPKTRLSLVLAAADGSSRQSHEALDALCRMYWSPLFAFVRRQGHDAEAARDLTQAFIAQLIEKRTLRQFNRERGRFRTFLLACLKHFLANEHDRDQAKKRGGGADTISLDAPPVDGWAALEPRDHVTPETVFERQWALEVLRQAMARLQEECAADGTSERFERLKEYLTREGEGRAYQDAALALGITQGAVKVAVHRLRERFHKCLREEVSLTVADASEIGDELRHLIAALRS